MFYARYLNLCTKASVSPSKVALECGFNKGSVSVWKKKFQKGEDVKPTSDILVKLADYFGVSVDYLLGNEKTSAEISAYDAVIVAGPTNIMHFCGFPSATVVGAETDEDGVPRGVMLYSTDELRLYRAALAIEQILQHPDN